MPEELVLCTVAVVIIFASWSRGRGGWSSSIVCCGVSGSCDGVSTVNARLGKMELGGENVGLDHEGLDGGCIENGCVGSCSGVNGSCCFV
jgi:hypothetical protein